MAKIVIIKNGINKILIVPEDDIERLVLQDIAKNPIEVSIPDRIEVDGVNYSDAMRINNIKPQ